MVRRHAHRGRRRAAPPQTTRRTRPPRRRTSFAGSLPVPRRGLRRAFAARRRSGRRSRPRIRPATTARLRRERAHRRSAQQVRGVPDRRHRRGGQRPRDGERGYRAPARSVASGCIARRSSRCRRRPRSTARPGPGRTRSFRTWTSTRTSGGAPSRSRSPRARAAPSGWRCSCRPRRRRGEYTGSVDVSWDSGAATVPVTLTVWPFTLPSSASLKTAFGFTYGAIPSGHGVSAAGAFAELRERYGRLALDHRVTLSHVDDEARRSITPRPTTAPRSRAPRPPRCAARMTTRCSTTRAAGRRSSTGRAGSTGSSSTPRRAAAHLRLVGHPRPRRHRARRERPHAQ